MTPERSSRWRISPDIRRRVLHVSPSTLQGIIRGRESPSAVVSSDGWRGQNGLVDLGYGHFCVDRPKDECASGPVRINGIENFRDMARVQLARFKDVSENTLYRHLKETEWRFNQRGSNKVRLLLEYIFENPFCQARPL